MLEIEFDDGARRIVNFKPFLFGDRHPDIKKYRAEAEFARFEIRNGNLNWNDYEMIFPLSDLYNSTIEG